MDRYGLRIKSNISKTKENITVACNHMPFTILESMPLSIIARC